MNKNIQDFRGIVGVLVVYGFGLLIGLSVDQYLASLIYLVVCIVVLLMSTIDVVKEKRR